MDLNQLLRPIRFRFNDPADVERYGDRWFVYSEAQIVRLPARKLIELELELGMTLLDAMNGSRESTVLGDLAAAWLAVHLEDPALAGKFNDFSPLIMLTTWEAATAEDLGKAPATLPPPEKPRRPSRGQARSGASRSTPTPA